MPVMMKTTAFCFSLPSHLLCNSRLKYTDIIMPVIISWSENLSLTLWEELRHKVFEKVIQRISDLRKKMWQEDRQLHNVELHTMCSLPGVTKTKSMNWRSRKQAWKGWKIYKETTLKNWREISLWKTGHEWEGNNKMGKKQTVTNKTHYSSCSWGVLQVHSSEYGKEYLGSIKSVKFYD
jgi:hypothetical protein